MVKRAEIMLLALAMFSAGDRGMGRGIVHAFKPVPTKCPADVVLLLDGSTSITSASWAALVKASTTFASELGVSLDGAHLGVVQFASSANVELSLTGDEAVAVKTVQGLVQKNGGTNTVSGLEVAANQFAEKQGGRLGAPKVVILITDGESNSGGDPVAVADRIKANETAIFGIGVGTGADMKQVTAIASEPASEYVFQLDDYEKLSAIVAALIAKTCVAVLTVDPDHGPPAGGTVVVVGGYGFSHPQFENSSSSSDSTAHAACRFGGTSNELVSFVNSTAVVCRTTAGTAGAAVAVSFAADGASFCPSSAVFRYDGGGPGCPTPDCDGHGRCVGNQCFCDSGWAGPNCDEKGCPNDCCGHGTCDPVSGTCTCNAGYAAPSCCNEAVMCCQYCKPDPKQPGHYIPSSFMPECYLSFCPGRFPDVIVESWQVNTTDGVNGCIFNHDPQTNRPCLKDYGYCK
eukprot:m.107733 g.107733  ORF g.107733 m.107733 type:complete len:460 (-) comp21170_c0_seq3:3280-4659(-)